MKREFAVFDFDGTLTAKDTLLEFIKYTCGGPQLYIGFMLHFPWLVMMKLHVYPNWKCKEKIFTWYFKGMTYRQFVQKCNDFSLHAQSSLRTDTTEMLERYLKRNIKVYVVSASIDEWVRPICKKIGIIDILATRIEVDSNGLLTGRFLSKNCYGQEKVNRLLEVEPNRDEYTLHAYGDSRGDKEMLAFADEGVMV